MAKALAVPILRLARAKLMFLNPCELTIHNETPPPPEPRRLVVCRGTGFVATKCRGRRRDRTGRNAGDKQVES